MKALGLIPARRGSRRCPRKNLLNVGGVTLVERAVRCALESGVLAAVAVSTDDEEVAAICSTMFSIDVVSVLWRPEEISGDVPVMRVVEHAAKAFWTYDALILLQPTSPLRAPSDVVAVYEKLRDSGGDTVISVVEHQESWSLMRLGHADRARQVSDGRIMIPNGAVYAIRMSALAAGIDWDQHTGVCYGYPMPKDRSLDVDTAMDVEIARFLLERNGP